MAYTVTVYAVLVYAVMAIIIMDVIIDKACAHTCRLVYA